MFGRTFEANLSQALSTLLWDKLYLRCRLRADARLERDDGQKHPFDDARTIANTGSLGTDQRVMKSPWKFARHGASGRWVSELLPYTGRIVDDLAVIKSLHTDAINHEPAILLMNTGNMVPGKASLGAETKPIDPLPYLRQWPQATPG